MDVTQLQQALTNVAMNGIQAMAPGGELRVHVERLHAAPPAGLGASAGEYACIAVEDHGVGIPAANVPHVFEPFFTTKDVGDGTGLGLSVTWGIVREHGGWIEVASRPGQGTTFRLFLSLGCAGLEAAAHEAGA